MNHISLSQFLIFPLKRLIGKNDDKKLQHEKKFNFTRQCCVYMDDSPESISLFLSWLFVWTVNMSDFVEIPGLGLC